MFDPAKHIIHLVGGRLAPMSKTTPQALAHLVHAAVASQAGSGIVVHIHGGLVSESNARETAEQRLFPLYEERAGAYPIFFVWESGFLEAPWNNLKEILRELIFKEFVKKVTEWVLKKIPAGLGFRGGGGLSVDEVALGREFDAWFDSQRAKPPDQLEMLPKVSDPMTARQLKGADIDDSETIAQIEESIDADDRFKNAVQAVYNGLYANGSVVMRGAGTTVATSSLLSKEAADQLFEFRPGKTKGGPIAWFKVAKSVAAIVFRVIRRLRSGRGHGGYATVVEEVLRQLYVDKIGRIGWWERMKGDTVDAFRTGPEYGGSAFLTALNAELSQANPKPRITLVGHSTGALFICHLLKRAATAAPDLVFDVIFEAPAATHDLLAATVEENGSRIRSLRQFGLSDEREGKDVLVPILYPRSLLYFVSGLLESETDEPLIGMSRYLENQSVYDPGEFPSIETSRRFYQKFAKSLVWSPSTSGPGFECEADRHGDFDDRDQKTMSSVAHIIRNGF